MKGKYSIFSGGCSRRGNPKNLRFEAYLGGELFRLIGTVLCVSYYHHINWKRKILLKMPQAFDSSFLPHFAPGQLLCHVSPFWSFGLSLNFIEHLLLTITKLTLLQSFYT